MSSTKIEWSQYAWNCIKGCEKISIGCNNCYALRMLKFDSSYKEGDVVFYRERLGLPLRWRDPKLIFVNSMSDLFHKNVKQEHLESIFSVMEQNKRHIFQVLTKRPTIARMYFENHPIPENLWLGVTVEHHDTVDRLNILRSIPCKRRFVSFEPLLSDIVCKTTLNLERIGWVIVGGENVPKTRGAARPMYDGWVMRIYEKCLKEGIPFFFKQYGSNRPSSCENEFDKIQQFPREFDCFIRKNEQLSMI